MISRIESIKNVGQFEKFHATESFEKNTVIFGFNGAGKSTLSDIFYSLASGERAEIITRRRTRNRPGEVGEKDIEIILNDSDGKDIIFDKESWNKLPKNMYVFNGQYINDYVFVSKQFEGDAVPIGMGTEGTNYMKQRENLATECKELLEDINEQIVILNAAGIKIKDISNQKVSKNTRMKRFESMASFLLYSISEKIAVEEKIKKNSKYSKELDDINRCEELYEKLKGVEVIEKSELLKSMKKIPRISSREIAEFLNETLTSADIKWAVAGYKNQKNKSICPMCGQAIADKRALNLFNKLGRYISQHKDERIREFCFRLNNLIGQIQMLDLDNRVKVFNEIVQLLDRDNLLLKNDAFRLKKGLSWNKDHNATLADIVNKIYNKVENPYSEIEMSDEEIQCLTLANEVIKNFIILKEIIIQSRSRLEKKIDKKMSVDDMKILYNLSYGPYRLNVEKIKDNARIYINRQNKIQELSMKIRDCYNQIELKEINSYLEKLNTSIKIEVNENEYYIKLKDFNAEKYEKHNEALFSEGEQRAIAFAYFLTEINRPENFNNKCSIIIDDPISSMDLSRKSIISYQIAELMKNELWQIIVMTHDISFVERIEGFFAKGIGWKKLELRSGKNDFLELNIKDYLTDDIHIYEELIRDAECVHDELTKIVALMSLRPFAFVKKVASEVYDIIEKRSTYFAHTLYSKNKQIVYKSEEYNSKKLKEYIDIVSTSTGTFFDNEAIIGTYVFEGFDFNRILSLYEAIPLDSMKNARKKVLLMRPLIEACFYQLSSREKFDPEHIGAMYSKTIKANKRDRQRHEICSALQEIYDSSKKYHHGADEGSLLGISWINPNEVEYYDKVLMDIIYEIRKNITIRPLSA